MTRALHRFFAFLRLHSMSVTHVLMPFLVAYMYLFVIGERLVSDDAANSLAKQVLHRSDAYKGWSVLVDTTSKFRKENGGDRRSGALDKVVVEGKEDIIVAKQREEMWFINPDCEADRGDFSFAWRSLVRNPGEPHLADEWLTNEFWSGSQNVARSGTEIFVSQVKQFGGFNVRIDTLGTRLYDLEIESLFASGPMCPGPARIAMVGRWNSGWMTELFEFQMVGETQHLGVDAWKMNIHNKRGFAVPVIITKTNPPIVVECNAITEDGYSKMTIDKLRTIDGVTFPAHGVYQSTTGLRVGLEFDLVEAQKRGDPGPDDWPVLIPPGSLVTNNITGERHEIPYTPDQYNKIRKWLLENAEAEARPRYLRYAIIGSINALVVAFIVFLLYRWKKARA